MADFLPAEMALSTKINIGILIVEVIVIIIGLVLSNDEDVLQKERGSDLVAVGTFAIALHLIVFIVINIDLNDLIATLTFNSIFLMG